MYAQPLVLFGLKFYFGQFSTSSHHRMCRVQTPGQVGAASLVGRAEAECGRQASSRHPGSFETVIPLAAEGFTQILGTSA